MSAQPLGRFTAAVAATEATPRRRRRVAPVALALIVALCVTAFASLLLGQYSLSLPEILQSFGRRLGLVEADPSMHLNDGALWNVRIPRIMLGLLVGAALATAGSITQGLFGNPLAEPGVIGITAGAGVGAAIAIVFGAAGTLTFLVPAAAFASGILTTMLVWILAASIRGSTTLVLVLVGISINAVAGAASSLVIFLADSTSREAIVFWQLGSLNGSTWQIFGPVAITVLIGLAWAMTLSRGLDSLAIGERAAVHTGLSLRRFRIQAILCAALLTAGAVAAAGVIGFVGLIVPHLLRLLVGPRQSLILPLSALGGALLIALSDLGARTLIPFTDLPIGVFTAVIGGPVFFILLRTRLRRGGIA
ncbi:FecCD family ABC transporter permease [Humidisolicoccus flavus]|uniref:FecCD family ABC transporter permease n=1 Tax=Humidisolicoccus flavus TaxID=3111414 RepID=UPI003253D5D9